jgi:hypothetical protein
MSNSRRQFLNRVSAALMAASSACRKSEPKPDATALPPGAPPAFGTAPDVGPPVSTSTFAEAEKLVQFELSPADRQMAAGNWRKTMAPLYERRTGPRKFSPPESVAPASRWDPLLPGQPSNPGRDRFIRTTTASLPLPDNGQDIAFAPLSLLSRWIESRRLTSERLTRLYLERLERFDPKLRCVITLTRDLALAQAKKADDEIAGGYYRGPLHGIPFGVKDLLDTANITTTWGAEPCADNMIGRPAGIAIWFTTAMPCSG